MKNLDLKECRDKLDVIDKEIVRLFEERMYAEMWRNIRSEQEKPFTMRRERHRRSQRFRSWPTVSSIKRR